MVISDGTSASDLPLIDCFDDNGPNSFLSNYYPVSIAYEGLTYPTVEHAFIASKTRDYKERLRVRAADTPEKAKQMGQCLKCPAPGFSSKRFEIMEALVRQKFSSSHLMLLLRSTGDSHLVGLNDWGDDYWGRCEGIGFNYLGAILMNLRAGNRESLRSQLNTTRASMTGPTAGSSRPNSCSGERTRQFRWTLRGHPIPVAIAGDVANCHDVSLWVELESIRGADSQPSRTLNESLITTEQGFGTASSQPAVSARLPAINDWERAIAVIVESLQIKSINSINTGSLRQSKLELAGVPVYSASRIGNCERGTKWS